MKKDDQMTNNKVIISSIFLTLSPSIASANDCSIAINSKESVKCLQRKIIKLEEQLKQSKKYQVALPKDAIIEFNAKACPVGWENYEINNNGIVTLQNKDIIKCQKS